MAAGPLRPVRELPPVSARPNLWDTLTRGLPTCRGHYTSGASFTFYVALRGHFNGDAALRDLRSDKISNVNYYIEKQHTEGQKSRRQNIECGESDNTKAKCLTDKMSKALLRSYKTPIASEE